MLPDESIARSQGRVNLPLPVPEEPNWLRYSPLELNFWTRLLLASTTQTFPEESIATPLGVLNWPLPVPLVPKVKEKVGGALTHFCTRLLPVSTTQKLPEESIAMPPPGNL